MGLWDDFYKTQTQGQYQPPAFNDLYGAYNKTPMLNVQMPPASSTIPPTAGVVQNAAQNPLMQLIMQLLAPKQQTTQSTGNNIATLVSALRNDPVGDANRMSSLPSYMPGSQSPFNTGYFKSANERYGDMVNKTGAYTPTDPAAYAATLRQMAGMRKDYAAPILSPTRLAPLFTSLYKNPRAIYQ